jgi:hypothetical protein
MTTMGSVQLEVMKTLYTYDTSLMQKAKYAYDLMSDLFKVKTDGRRLKEQKNLIYMLMFYTARMANNNQTPLVEIGKMIATIEGREKPYDHSSVINAVNKHIERVQMGKRGGWDEYVDQFDKFCTAMYNSYPVFNPKLDSISTRIVARYLKKTKRSYGYLQRS